MSCRGISSLRSKSLISVVSLKEDMTKNKSIILLFVSTACTVLTYLNDVGMQTLSGFEAQGKIAFVLSMGIFVPLIKVLNPKTALNEIWIKGALISLILSGIRILIYLFRTLFRLLRDSAPESTMSINENFFKLSLLAFTLILIGLVGYVERNNYNKSIKS